MNITDAQAAAIEQSAERATEGVLALAVPVVLLVLGVVLGFTMRRPTEEDGFGGRPFRKTPLIICWGLALLIVVSQLARPVPPAQTGATTGATAPEQALRSMGKVK